MNIYRHEIKQNIKSLYIWSLVLIGISIFFMMFFPTIKADIDIFNDVLKNYPESLRAVFGLALNDISSAIGYYGFVFVYVILFGAIQACNLGVSTFSKELRDKTADFILTKPVSRMKILTSKIFACLTILLCTNIIYNLVIFLYMILMFGNEIVLKQLLLLNLSLFFIELIFFSLGMLCAIVLKKIRSVLPVSLMIVFFFYTINIVAIMGKNDKILSLLTPFRYFVPSDIIANNSYGTKYIIAMLIILITCTFASYTVYRKKDINN